MSVWKMRDLFKRLEKYYMECNRTSEELKALYPPDIYKHYSTSIIPIYSVVIVHNFYASREWFSKDEVKKKIFVAVIFLFDVNHYTNLEHYEMYNDTHKHILAIYSSMAKRAGFDTDLEKRYRILNLNVWNSLIDNYTRRKKKFKAFKKFIAQVDSVDLHS